MTIAWSSLEKQIGHMTAEETMDLLEYLWNTILGDTEREVFVSRHLRDLRDMLPEEEE